MAGLAAVAVLAGAAAVASAGGAGVAVAAGGTVGGTAAEVEGDAERPVVAAACAPSAGAFPGDAVAGSRGGAAPDASPGVAPESAAVDGGAVGASRVGSLSGEAVAGIEGSGVACSVVLWVLERASTVMRPATTMSPPNTRNARLLRVAIVVLPALGSGSAGTGRVPEARTERAGRAAAGAARGGLAATLSGDGGGAIEGDPTEVLRGASTEDGAVVAVDAADAERAGPEADARARSGAPRREPFGREVMGGCEGAGSPPRDAAVGLLFAGAVGGLFNSGVAPGRDVVAGGRLPRRARSARCRTSLRSARVGFLLTGRRYRTPEEAPRAAESGPLVRERLRSARV